jgi:hypothetical protein
MTTRTKTKANADQLAFNFTPVRPDFPICENAEEIGATLAAFGINGKSKTPTVLLAGPKVTPQVPALAGMTPLGIPAATDASLEAIGGTPDEIARTLHNAAVRKHPNATFESSPGSTHRVILHREYREGHRLFRSIQFPGATYSDGSPRIQTVNGGCVTPDPF